jgi:hypothetical protein
LRLTRSCVPDYATRDSADDRAHGATDYGAGDRAAYDTSDGSITVGQGELGRRDKGQGCDEREGFLVHFFLLLRFKTVIIGNCVSAHEFIAD